MTLLFHHVEPTPSPRKSAALRWALGMSAVWAGISLIFLVGVVPHLPKPVERPTAHAEATGGLFYHASHEMSYSRDDDGSFYIDASVNSHPVRFRVDPAVSAVLLSSEDAAAVGIETETLTYDQRLRTKNGEIAVARVGLHYLTVRELTMFGLSAAVSRRSQVSVLGASFLERFSNHEIKDGTLFLRW